MANNLYTATETLLLAYKEALDEHRANVVELLAEDEWHDRPSVSEMLIMCYKPKSELFPTRTTERDDSDSTKKRIYAMRDFMFGNAAKKDGSDSSDTDIKASDILHITDSQNSLEPNNENEDIKEYYDKK